MPREAKRLRFGKMLPTVPSAPRFNSFSDWPLML